MNSPVPPQSLSPEEKAPDSLAPVPAPCPNPSNCLAEQILLGPAGLRLGWRILLYLGVAAAVAYALLWLGRSFFPEIASGVARLWQEMYGEAVLLIAALAPGFLMARIEGRSVDDYGLPRQQAFGKLFWMGALWGIVSIALLLVLLRGVHVFYFGQLALHGLRIWRFALFWGAYF